MPLQPDVQYVSVDDHLLEPPDLWTSRLPAALVERGPRLVETTEDTADDFGKVFAKGSEAWLYDGAIVTQTMGMGIAGVPVEERGRDALRYDAVRPGCWSPKERLVDMDADGVQVQCCFPTFPRFAGTRFVRTPDRALAEACVRAYNATHAREWSCASCHTANPTQAGKHASTGKSIQALAPAAEGTRFTDVAKTEKWFRRNCNDVLARECTAGEKANLLAWLVSLKR